MTAIFQVLRSYCRLRSLELACSERCSLKQDLIDFKTRTTGPYDRISIRKPFFYRVSPNFSLWNQQKPLKYVCFKTSRSPVGILTQDHLRSLETEKYTNVSMRVPLVPCFLIKSSSDQLETSNILTQPIPGSCQLSPTIDHRILTIKSSRVLLEIQI